MKGLDYRDPLSLQATNVRWRKIIRVYCAMRNLNGFMARKLPRRAPVFRDATKSLRRVSVTARKPANRGLFLTLCTEAITTRVGYDRRISHWVEGNTAAVEELLGEALDEAMRLFFPLWDLAWDLFGKLEGNNVSLGLVQGIVPT
jgi:hypothetical protein